MTCYHQAMKANLNKRTAGQREAYLYSEEYKWLTTGPKPLPLCESKCDHWPLFSIVPGNPRKRVEPVETYKGFRSDPRPLMGVLRLGAA